MTLKIQQKKGGEEMTKPWLTSVIELQWCMCTAWWEIQTSVMQIILNRLTQAHTGLYPRWLGEQPWSIVFSIFFEVKKALDSR